MRGAGWALMAKSAKRAYKAVKKMTQKEISSLRASQEFDEEWYLQEYPDVEMLGMSPLEHYLWIGQKLGRLRFPSLPHMDSRRLQPPSEKIICEAGENGYADLFSLRAMPFKAERAILAHVTNYQQFRELDSALRCLRQKFDLILSVSNSMLIDEHCLSKNANNLAIVFHQNTKSAASSFIHIANSGALSDYTSVCWINGELGFSNSALQSVSECWSSTNFQDSLFSSSLTNLSREQQASVAGPIGTFFARLGRKKPVAILQCPVGSVTIIPPLVVHQLTAYRIQPTELSDRKASAPLISAILSSICDEAGIAKKSFEPGKPKEARKSSNRAIKTIAFYLPQFHPIPENDSWWGKGFTEWTNVVKARPLFRSHGQPYLPSDLGYYDLRLPETQKAQADLARLYGVHGFCYYYYWFDGKKLLEQPLEQMLSSGQPDFPFCVCWANENWSRNWDGQNRHVLLEQSYSMESNRELIHEFITMMKDPRYIRHDGKPVLLVYRIRVIPNWMETSEMWRDECRKADIGEIHLCAVRFGLEPLDGHPSEFGVDAFVLFPPHEAEKVDAKSEVLDLAPDFNGTIFGYDAVVDGDIARFEEGYPWPVHRGTMLGWDNTARRPRDSRIFIGATPARFHHWLKEVLRQEEQYNLNSESLVFVNAWNEWAEGTTLEPSTRFGRGYLEAVKSALGDVDCDGSINAHASGTIDLGEPPLSFEWYEGNKKPIEHASTVLVCAHVVSHQLFGGERSFLDVLDALSNLQINIVVALPTKNHDFYIKLVRERAVGVAVIPYLQWTNRRNPDEHIVEAFCDLIEFSHTDIVYSNTIVLVEPAIAARRLKKKSVIHARELINHDPDLTEKIGYSKEDILRDVFDRSDYIIANSMATYDFYHRENRTFVAPNIVNATDLDFPNVISENIVFAIASSNLPKKGVGDFLDVARRCEFIAPSARFLIFGPENSYTDELKRRGLPTNLALAGYAENPGVVMKAANVILSLSHFAESFGRTIAEAQVARRPVIAYQQGAVPELVEDGITGFLVPPHDVERICAIISRLCENRELIAMMGEAGRAKIQRHYSPETLRDNLWHAFESISNYHIPMRNDRSPQCTVIVPIFNAYDELKSCLVSIENHIDLSANRVLLINDCSTDPRIAPLMREYACRAGFHLIINKKNVGYTGTINIGIRWAGEDDILLLNSDTIVTSGFLDGLQRTAFHRGKVGTVTAMSDNAGAFSFPISNKPNPKPKDVSYDEHAASILIQTVGCEPVEVPTGSGFCMYIRRALFNAIGFFDEETFPRGYGEENDFCMRALNAGWRNFISPHAYVFHVRSASFGAEKEKIIEGAVAKVTTRYPDYADKVRLAFSSKPIQSLRSAVRRAVAMQTRPDGQTPLP